MLCIALDHITCFNNTNMANTYHQIYLQTVFPVKYRHAQINKIWKDQLFAVMGNLINESNAKTIIVNGTADHVHCFFGLKPVMSVAELMKIVKAKSSKYVNDHNLTPRRFEWQEGYGVFSYHHRDVDTIYHYIKDQEEHHKKKSFHEEYIEALIEFNVPFDSRCLFYDPIPGCSAGTTV
jgi:putative transposase